VLVAERVADRADPLAHPQRGRIAQRRHRQAGLAVDLDQRDVGVGIGADGAGAKRPPVRELDDDALGAVDDVVVGEDAAVGVDDEAAAGAGLSGGSGMLVRPRRRRPSCPRAVASMLTTAGLMRSTTSAKLIAGAGIDAPLTGRAAPRTALTFGAPADIEDWWTPPATMAPTRRPPRRSARA
jgi:hypothetical protein